jgi:hypothetical protein
MSLAGTHPVRDKVTGRAEGSNIVNEMNRNAIFGKRKMDVRQKQKGKVLDHNASASRTAAS